MCDGTQTFTGLWQAGIWLCMLHNDELATPYIDGCPRPRYRHCHHTMLNGGHTSNGPIVTQTTIDGVEWHRVQVQKIRN